MCLLEGEEQKKRESVGEDTEALAEMGTVRDEDVWRLTGHDSVVRVDSSTEFTSESESEQSSMTIYGGWGLICGGGTATMTGAGIGKGAGESGRKSSEGW